MHPFLRTRVCSAVSLITAFTLAMTTALSTVPVAYAAGAVSSPVALSAQPAAPSGPEVEDISKRTETSRTYRQSDGTFRAEIYEKPIHFLDASGIWQGIDTNLVSDIRTGAARTRSASAVTTVRGEGTGKRPVRFERDGWSVELDMLGAAENMKLVSGNRARFLAVAPSTDLEYESLPDGIKETIVLHAPSAPSTFTFFMAMQGVELRHMASSGWMLYRPGAKEPVASLGGLNVADSSLNAAGDPAYCEDTTMTVRPVVGGAYVTYEVSPTWLQDPARTYPVKIDPTISSSGDTFVSSKYTTTNYGSSTELKVGYYDSTTGHNRALVKFDVATAIPKMSYINSATYSVYQFHTYHVDTPKIAYLARATKTWSESSTWSSLDCAVNSEGGLGTWIASQSPSGRDIWVNWSVTSVVQGWRDGQWPNYGFMMYQDEGSAAQQPDCWRKFYSSEWATASLRPKLVVSYTAPSVTQSGLQTTYREGDVVAAAHTVATPHPEDITSIRALGNYVDAAGVIGPASARRGGFMQWSAAPPLPESEWTSVSAPGGGYFALYSGAADYGQNHIEPVWEACSVTSVAGVSKTATLAFRVIGAWGDAQQNDLDVWVSRTGSGGSAPSLGWIDGTVAFNVLPASAPGLSASTTAASWFSEPDTNGDGLADAGSDTNASGRGAVGLSWTPSPLATTYRVYLFDGATYRPVATTTAGAWSSSGAGLYPSDTEISALTANTTTNPYKSGTGLDLRDDPTALYAKTPGTTVDNVPAYFFKVTGVNSAGETSLSDAPTRTVQLASRTKKANEASAHTILDLGFVAGDGAQAELDSGVLALTSTDLAIDSYGPVAALTRTYRSDVTSQTVFGEGWRFNFEQSVGSGPGTSRTYTDEAGDVHRFLAVGTNVWTAPHSMVATLTYSPTSSTYGLSFKGGTTLAFDSGGRLASESDRHVGATTYAWSGADALTITAANGHFIAVTFAGGRITGATYATASGTRRVDYLSRTSVRRYLSASETAQVDYTYVSSRISAASVKDFAPGGVPAVWDFSYTSGRLSRVHLPHPVSITERSVDIGAPVGSTVTVSHLARVGLATSDQTVTETYGWDPTGREISRTVPSESGSALTDYAASGHVRHSVTAAGVITESVTDARGNELLSWDDDGHMTTSLYSSGDDLISTTDPRGAQTLYTYNTASDVLTQRNQLNATEWSQTSYDYTGDTHGRVQSETKALNAATSAVTTYSNYGSFMEAGTVTQVGVALSSAGGTAPDLTTSRVFDGFGQLLTETDPLLTVVSANTYDLSGRLVSQQDAAGVLTNRRYDVLGSEVETSRTVGVLWADWTTRVADPTGLVLSETTYVKSGAAVVPANTTDHLYDGSGSEITVSVSDVGTSKTAYDIKGDVSATWQPGSDLTTTDTAQNRHTDADGREETSQITTGTAAVTAYATGVDEVSSFDPPTAAATAYTYDEAGNQATQVVPLASGSAIEVSEFDLGGRQVRATDALGRVTVSAYDLAGRLISTTLESAGRGTTTTYNALGWVLTATDPDGRTTKYVYDRAGRVTDRVLSVTGTTDAVTHHVLDAMGNDTLITNPDGTSVQTTYDVFGRATRRVETAGGAAVHDVRSLIDELGRTLESSDTVTGLRSSRTPATSAAGITVTTKTLADATMTVMASAAGIEATRTFSAKGAPMGGVLSVSLKSRNLAQIPQMWKISFPGVGSHYRTDVFDSEGRMQFQMDQTTASYGYDARTGQKTSESVSGNALGATQASTYAYTDEGRLSSSVINGASAGYSYDSAGQIQSAGPITFTYADDKLATSAAGGVATAYTFDLRGRRTRQVSPSLAATYTWDPQSDRLTSYALDRAPLGSPDIAATFSYDASGQRTGSVVTSGGVTTTTLYTYEGLQLTRLATVSGSVTTTLTYLYDELARPLAIMASSSDTSAVYAFSPQVNARGDVIGLVDMAGAPAARWSFDVWGNPTGATSAGTTGPAQVPAATAARIAAIQPLRYAGYSYDTFSGLYYCSQRYYDPATMQFISADPAQADGEESAYQYCGGDPVGKVDPSGLETIRFGENGAKVTSRRCPFCGTTLWSIKVVNRHARQVCALNPYLKPFVRDLRRLRLIFEAEGAKGVVTGWQLVASGFLGKADVAVSLVFGALNIAGTMTSGAEATMKVAQRMRSAFTSAAGWQEDHADFYYLRHRRQTQQSSNTNSVVVPHLMR